jgi:tetratricopeptide (TPR) repeat protein
MNSLITYRAAWVILTVAAVYLGGCGSKTVDGKAGDESGQFRVEIPQPEFEHMDRRAYYHYVTGLLLEGEGDYYNAAISYQKALRHYPNSPELSLSMGKALFYLQQYNDAITALAQAEPQSEEILGLTARSYHALGMPDSVRSTYLRLVEVNPENSLAYSFLAGYYRQIGDLDSTVWAYEQLTDIRSDSYRQFNELARLYVQQREFEKARETFRKSLAIDSTTGNMMAVIGLGEVFLMEDQIDSAIVSFKWGLNIDAYNLVLHRELTGLYIRQDSLYEALDHAKVVVELSPMDEVGRRRLGILYFSVDSLALADSVLSKLVADGDRNSANHFYLGRVAALQEDWPRATDEFTLLTQLADSVDRSWLDLGFAYRQLGQPEKEIETYRAGLNHMRDEESAINLSFALGAAYEQSGQIEEAVKTFEEIISHDPDHAQSLNYLGYMLADRGEQLDYARDLIGRAVALSPDNAAYLDSFGWVYYRMGDYEEALKHLQRAVELDIDPVIFDHLGDTFHALGEADQAKEWWQKALEQEPDNEDIKRKLDQ